MRSKLVHETPSTVAQSSVYKSMQENPDEKLLDDRPAPDAGIPPISLLYSGFGHFIDVCSGRRTAPGHDQIDRPRLRKAVDTFANRMCDFFQKEVDRRDAGLDCLNEIYRSRNGPTPFPELLPSSRSTWTSDGHFTSAHHGISHVVEFKNENTGNKSNAKVQAAAYTAQSHTELPEELRPLFKGWRLPCLGMTVVG